MATTYKVLGQSAPGATTPSDVYTVPSATSAVVSTINVCNRDAVASRFRISVRPAGATQADQHYLAYDTAIPGNDSIALTFGITLAATDVITVYSESGDLSFNVFGSELA